MRRTFLLLSVSLLFLVILAASLGIFVEDLYRDNLLVRAGWYGNDLVTLCLAMPLLVISTILTRRGSLCWALIWSGVLAYTLYCYAFYLFGAAFNSLYLVYVGIIVVSTFGLIFALTSSQIQQIVREVNISKPARTAGILVILVSIMLGSFWIMTSLPFIWSGEVPAMVTAVDHPTNVTGALDLWMVVSFGFLGGVWLLQRRAWGYIIATIWSIKGLLYMSALSAAAIAQFNSGATGDLVQLAIWVPIGLVCFISSWLLLRACPG